MPTSLTKKKTQKTLVEEFTSIVDHSSFDVDHLSFVLVRQLDEYD